MQGHAQVFKHLGCGYCAREYVRVQGQGIGGVIRLHAEPFQTCDICQVRQAVGRSKALNEVREATTVAAHDRMVWRVFLHKHVGHAMEKRFAHPLGDHRKTAAQRVDQTALYVVSVHGKPARRITALRADHALRATGLRIEQGGAEGLLHGHKRTFEVFRQ